MELQSDRSKKDIADALISLMKKKDFNKITNKDITNRAGLSHITIYRNFNNKDEIVKYYLDELTDEFIKTSKILFDPNDFTNYLIKLFTHLEKNKDIGILLYKANSLNEEFTYSFISGGLYNIYYYWIKNGCKESPQELAEMFKDFYILKGK